MKEKNIGDVVEEQILTIKLRAEDSSKKLMKYKLKITNLVMLCDKESCFPRHFEEFNHLKAREVNIKKQQSSDQSELQKDNAKKCGFVGIVVGFVGDVGIVVNKFRLVGTVVEDEIVGIVARVATCGIRCNHVAKSGDIQVLASVLPKSITSREPRALIYELLAVVCSCLRSDVQQLKLAIRALNKTREVSDDLLMFRSCDAKWAVLTCSSS
ncbi:hypothetical protein Tco_0700870 [Tanacetum coccineum]